MGKLFQVGKVFIRLYGRDHRPPHFHVVGPDSDAIVEIETLIVLGGEIPRAARKVVMEWAVTNRPALIAEWNRLNPLSPA